MTRKQQRSVSDPAPWWVAGQTSASFPVPAPPAEPPVDPSAAAGSDPGPGVYPVSGVRGGRFALGPPRRVRARAEAALSRAFGFVADPSSRVQVDRARPLGDGMSRSGWRAAVTVEPDPHGLTDDWVVLLPRPDAPRGGLAERMRREVQVLVGLAERGVPFRLPEVLAAWDEGNLSVLVERFVPGIPLDLRTGRQGSVRPWEVVARVAAAVHRVPIAVGGYPTRLAHAKAALRSLEHVGGELAERAWAWAADHMPPDEPTVLIHGDLLGQNILLGLDAPPGVIDWEYTQQGDPAWDFAIVTRGVSRPFQVSHGLDRLLEAYAAESSIDVRREHVHLYELSLLGEDGEHDHDGRAHARLRALLERLKA